MAIQTKTIGRMPTDHGPYDPELAYGKRFQCELFGCVWESMHDDNNTAPATWDGGDIITPNIVDWKKVCGSYESWLMNVDKPSSTGTTGTHPYNGMGRVVLKKNMVNDVNTLTQDMFYKGEAGSRVPNTDTVFVIKYDFVLGEDITVPANCVLEFGGGSLSGQHTITGNNTSLGGVLLNIFAENLNFAGSWNCPWISTDMFKSLSNANSLRKLLGLASDDIYNEIFIKDKGYNYIAEITTEDEVFFVVPSKTKIISCSTIIVETNSLNSYALFGNKSVDNIEIIGGTYIGDKETHGDSGGTSEYCHCFDFRGSRSITITDVNISQFPGDGIYMGSTGGEGVSDIRIENAIITYCNRNGISILQSDRVLISNCRIDNISGDPGAAIDIEPNASEVSQNIVINNIQSESCVNGIRVYGAKSGSATRAVTLDSIRIRNINERALVFRGNSISLNNCFISQSQEITENNGRLIDCATGVLNINGLYIETSNALTKPLIWVEGGCVVNISGSYMAGNVIFKNDQGYLRVENSRLYGDVMSEKDYGKTTICDCFIMGYITAISSNFTLVNNAIHITTPPQNHGILINDRKTDKLETVEIKGNVFELNNTSITGYFVYIRNVKCSVIRISDNTFICESGEKTAAGGVSLNLITGKVGGTGNVISKSDLTGTFYTDDNHIIHTFDVDLNDGSLKPNYEKGSMRFDVNAGKPVWWTGSAWVDATGTPV